jgi:hypothetical protein
MESLKNVSDGNVSPSLLTAHTVEPLGAPSKSRVEVIDGPKM